jgi:ABC-type oligopeptide transport system ATPase subunit
MATRNVTAVKAAPERRLKNASRVAVLQHAANELVFGLVGHVGSGTSTVAATLCELLKSPALGGGSYDTVILSAREEIENWANQTSRPVPQTDRLQLETDVAYQNLGDDMRLSNLDNSVVASALIKKIRSTRAKSMGLTADVGGAVVPDGKRRAYILESLRHPDEVELLRHIYQDAFILIGTVCDFEKRVDRITQKYKNAGRIDAIGFMKRDAQRY